ncbi:MAG: flavodoxin family protein [Methanotrichaceae archaeon]
MKILGINASPRGSQSQTLRLVKAVLDGARSEGADVELVDACKLDIEYCNGCTVCFKTGECVKEDDFQELYKKMLESDGMIWGAPNYFRSVTAQMKTIIDRMADAIHCQLFTGKYSCSVATGGSNYEEVTNYLNALLLNFGSFVTGSTGVAMNKGPKALDDAEKKAFELGKTLVEDIKTKRDYISQREMQEENRKYFQALVKMRGKDWEHEYEYWNKLDWK